MGQGGSDATESRGSAVLLVVLPAFAVMVVSLAVLASHLIAASDASSRAAQLVALERVVPPPGRGARSTPIGRPAPLPSVHGGFAFTMHQRDGVTPVAWDPCRPIHFVVNPRGAPADGAVLVRRAIAQVHTLTGFTFVDDGVTDELPAERRAPYQPARYGARWAPVLIAWSDAQSYPLLDGSVAGMTQAIPWAAPGGNSAYVSAQLVLDAQDLSKERIADRTLALSVVLHELAHVVGLEHTPDRSQLMYPESNAKVREFADGDRYGLSVLGAQACHPEL